MIAERLTTIIARPERAKGAELGISNKITREERRKFHASAVGALVSWLKRKRHLYVGQQRATNVQVKCD